MQIYKKTDASGFALLMFTCGCLCANVPALAEDSSQIIALQKRVIALEKELLSIQSLLRQNAAKEHNGAPTAREVTLSALDKLTLTVGQSSLALSKNGRVTLNGTVFDVKTTQNQDLSGSKINDN